MTFFAVRSIGSPYCIGTDDTAAALETEMIAGHHASDQFQFDARESPFAAWPRSLTVFLGKDTRVFVICYRITEKT